MTEEEMKTQKINRLIIDNLGIIYKIARSFDIEGYDTQDLVNEAIIKIIVKKDLILSKKPYPRAYMITVAKFRIYNIRRDVLRREEIFDEAVKKSSIQDFKDFCVGVNNQKSSNLNMEFMEDERYF